MTWPYKTTLHISLERIMKTSINKLSTSNSNSKNAAFNRKIFTKTTLAIAFTGLISASAFSVAGQQDDRIQPQGEELQLVEKESVNQAVGLGTGIVFGAAVAGPVGAAVAGLFGLFIADDINDEKRLDLTQNELNRTTEELTALQQDYQDSVANTSQQIAEMDSAMTKEIQQVTPYLEANIQFKTASFLIEDHYKSLLDGLASQLRKNPSLKIELSGFSDQRGESTYNQVLSEQRAKAVKDYLVSQFVNEQQVIAQSFGESELVSESDNFEDNFFDRRVTLKISNKPAEMTAANN
ncbi:MAG: peptidoglycan-associated lipoprotein [Glaciecola sp.]|jgi:peptidoglycan-associated lipoprotein